MSKNSICAEAGLEYYNRRLLQPGDMPVSFVYGARRYKGCAGEEFIDTRISDTDTGVRTVHRARLDDNMTVRTEIFLNREFGECEYTVWFENTGSRPSEVLRDVYVLDEDFEGEAPVLRGNLGDHDNWYAQYEHDLTKGD